VSELLTLSVRDVRVETPRTRIAHLALEGRRLSWRAGQAVLLGSHGQPVRKPYSIACTPQQARQDGALEFLIQVGEDGTAGPHLGRLEPGLFVDVEGPFGSFVLPADPPERYFLFVAGGTGIAPLRAMLWHALADLPDRAISVLQSARAADEFAYARELRALAGEGRIVLKQTATRAAPRWWTGGRGRIAPADLRSMIRHADTRCYVCGPSSLVEDVPRLLRDLGVGDERIVTEQWSETT